MPYQHLRSTLRHVSPWRLVLLLAVVYLLVFQGVPWMQGIGLPYWVRVGVMTMGPVIGLLVGPWLYGKRL